jgi:hypothetical protein
MKRNVRFFLIFAFFSLLAAPAGADETTAAEYLKDAQTLFKAGQYFKAARYAFAADQRAEGEKSIKAEAYSWITVSLVRAGLPNAAAYFFIRTLQIGEKTGDKGAIRRALSETEPLLLRVGGDLLRKYLIRGTTYEDYDSVNRSAYLYSLGKEALLTHQEEKAIGYFSSIDSRSPLYPYSLELRGSAYAIAGKNENALLDFRHCQDKASSIENQTGDLKHKKQYHREADDLRSRCYAGEARTLYQAENFEDAELTYDRIPKQSFVWPDILFEQAWNAFAKQEYNRTLGKLVSYKSPALDFVFNSEIDVLRAQAFLALCLYNDANDVINEFNHKYARTGEEVKAFVEGNSGDLGAFYEFGREALHDSLYTDNGPHRMANRFVRGPYFQNLVSSERDLSTEMEAVRNIENSASASDRETGRGFPGFLEQVVAWRMRTLRLLGGAFVKNSLLDYHAALISDFEKMAFIKLEMLKRAKDKLLSKGNPQNSSFDRSRGNVEPHRRGNQYYWSFNGEFWNDELGDYVFGLESECNEGKS